jgi:transcription antitermination factor NusG
VAKPCPLAEDSGFFPRAFILVIRPSQIQHPTDLSSVEETPASPPPPWFAIFTHPRYEKKVAEHLQARSIENFLPTYQSKRIWKNRQTVTLDVPLFPSYLFARIRPRDRGCALGVPGVLGIVGGPCCSAAVPDQYIDTLRTGLALRRIFPHPEPEIGERVRIVAGPLAGVEGILTFFKSVRRVVLSIELIRQWVSIEVSRDEIEPTIATPRTQL